MFKLVSHAPPESKFLVYREFNEREGVKQKTYQKDETTSLYKFFNAGSGKRLVVLCKGESHCGSHNKEEEGEHQICRSTAGPGGVP